MNGGPDRGWRVASLVFAALTGIVTLLAAIGYWFAPALVDLYAAAFHSVPGKFELTVSMTRIMMPFFPLVALSAAVMAILNACGAFFVPAFSSAMFNIVSVLCGVGLTFFCEDWWGIQPIEGMALGVVAGGVAQVGSQLPTLWARGYRWRGRGQADPNWYADPALRKMLLLMVPGTVGLAATQVNILVNSVLATGQGTGAVSWLNYAFRLMQFPIGIFGVSLASATLPRIAALWTGNDRQGFASTLTGSLRQVIAVNVPASVGLAVLGGPIISLIFEYGAYTPAHARNTAIALAAYSIGLTAYSAVKVLVPAFYVMGESRIPVQASLFTIGLNIGLNLITVRHFGYWGLALGTSVTAMINSLVLLVLARRRLADVGFRLLPFFSFTCRVVALSGLMGLACWAANRSFEQMVPPIGPIGLMRLMQVAVSVLVGGGLVFSLAGLFGITELELFAKYVVQKIKKSLGQLT